MNRNKNIRIADRVPAFPLLAAALLLCAAQNGNDAWTIGGETVHGKYEALMDGVVHLRRNGDEETIDKFPFGDFSEAGRRAIVDAGDTALPERAPEWKEGYAVRYIVRVMGDPLDQSDSQTVMASIPTGGWLKPDASDLRVVTLGGSVLPLSILSHDPKGNTLLQFTRNGMDRWYWVYAVNPDAPPQVDERTRRRVERTGAAAAEASLKVMELRRAAAESAGELRGAERRLRREKSTIEKAEAELSKLAPLISKQREDTAEAAKAVPPLETSVAESESRLERAEEKVRRETEKLVSPAERLAEQAESELETAVAAYNEALRRASAVFDEIERMRIVNEARAAKLAARRTLEMRKEAVAEAEEALVPVRMAAASARTELDDARKKLSSAETLAARRKKNLEELVEQRTRAEKLKAASEAVVAELSPQIGKMRDASKKASEKAAEAAAAAEKLEKDFKAMSLAVDPRAYREGLSMEVRDWGGDQLDELSDWAVVVNGLKRSDNVLGGAFVTDVLQTMNPFRLGDPLNFAASYRGFLKIEEPGLYRLFLNADDASFLFLNEYLVYSRVGPNRPVRGRVHVFEIGEDIELDAGVYRLEIHQVTGNSPGAEGRCTFHWMPPDATSWSYVPPEAFVQALPAVTAGVESFDGRPVAVPVAGMANTLNAGGINLHLARFKAAGAGDGFELAWDFGDGLHGAGPAVEHVYLGDGDYDVSLASHPDLPPFTLRVHAWDVPVPTCPLALGDAVRVMDGFELDRLDAGKLGEIFAFLSICGQPERWPLVERVSRRLLDQEGIDPQYRVELHTALMESLARRGRAAEAIELADEALDAAGGLRSLVIDVQLKLAEIYRLHLRDFDEADRRYAAIVEDNRRLSLDSVRRAAIAWGDMFVDIGDTSRAAEIYRMASGLGAKRGAALGAATDAATRGAMLRAAERQLRDGDIRNAGHLLDRIESEHPEQKVEGLYRFLRAETDRHAGRYLGAIRNYEVVLNLRQWAGYRAPAMLGLAHCHYHIDDFDSALGWLDAVRDSFPAFYEQRELAPFREVVAAGRDAVEKEDAGRDGDIAARFDPDAPVPSDMSYRFLPVPGMTPAALVMTGRTDRNSQFFEVEMENIVSEGAYWLEFWYQNEFAHSYGRVNPNVNIRFFGEEGVAGSNESVPVVRTFGQHFIGAALLRAPVAHQGRIRLTFDSFHGVQRIHGLRVRPVTAFQEEALFNFIEGLDTPVEGVWE